MSLRFILGRAGSGKTHYCLSELARLIKKDPGGRDLVLIVPEQATFIHERMLAANFGLSGFARVDVTSFSRLSYRAAKELGQKKLPQLSRMGKMMALANILIANREELAIFPANTLKSGIAASLLDALEEIALYDRSGQGLEQALASCQAEEGQTHFTAKLGDLSLLFEAMAAFCAHKYADSGSGLDFLLKAVEERDFLRGARVYIDGFANFSPREKAVITALAKTARVELALALDPAQRAAELREVDLFYPTYDTYRSLALSLHKCGLAAEEPLLLDGAKGRFSLNGELAFLEQNFYRRGPQRQWPAQAQNISLNVFADKKREIEYIAREICRLVREEGYRYREIGVIARDAAPYEDLLAETLGEAGVPFFIDSKKKLLYHPLLELVNAALEVAGEGWHYHTVFRYLKCGLVPAAPEEIDRLENYCLAAGIRPYHWLTEADWHFWPLGLGEKAPDPGQKMKELAQINDIRRRSTAALLSFCRSLKDEKTVSGMISLLRALLEDLGTEKALADLAAAAIEKGEGEEAALHRQVAKGLEGLLGEAETFLGDASLTLENLRGVLAAGFSELTLSLIPVGLDQVFIASIERSRSPELRAVFLFDLNLGAFPAKIASAGVISEPERAKLKKVGLNLAPSVNERQFGEAFLLYLALTRASERLYLSYALTKADGSPALPSAALAHIKTLFPALRENLPDPESDPSLLIGGAVGLKDLSAVLSRLKSGEEIAAFWPYVRRWYEDKPSYAGLLARIDAGLDYRPSKDPLSAAGIDRLFGGDLSSSVSRLEKYRDCPFAYFAAYGMKIAKRRVYQLSAPDKGQLFHQVLADIAGKIAAEGPDWQTIDKEAAERLVDGSLDAYLPGFLGDILFSSARYQYLAGRLRATLVQSLLFWVEHMKNGSFRPVAWEISFGPRGEWPALILPLADGRKLEISGRIDRIDLAGEGENVWIRVIDYKSGNENLTVRDIEEGLKLQLFVYLMVALENAAALGAKEAKAAGVYYSLVRDDMYSYKDIPLTDDNQKGFQAGLKLKGLTVSDPSAVRLADRDLCGVSKLIPVGIKEDGSFYKRMSGVTEEQWTALSETIRGFLLSTAEAMFSGLMAASPNNKKSRPVCDYCDYKAFCGLEGEFAREESGLVGGGGESDE